jgi:type I restriction enzyme M protein
MVPLDEIASESNGFNLNLPRYIDSSEPEDLHDLDAHLNGGIPNRDIDALGAFWEVFPTLRSTLFRANGRKGYSDPRVEGSAVKAAILEHEEFQAFAAQAKAIVEAWRAAHDALLRGLDADTLPRQVIQTLSEDLLARHEALPLVDAYDIYQRLMEFWEEVMQDDVYLIVAEGWNAGRSLREAYDKETPEFTIRKGRKTTKYVGELVPAPLVVAPFFPGQQAEIDRLEATLDELGQRKDEFEEEHGGEGGALEGLEGARGVTKGNVQDRAVEIRDLLLKTLPEGTLEYEQAVAIGKSTFGSKDWKKGVEDEDGLFEELDILYDYLRLTDEESEVKKAHKEALLALHQAVRDRYPTLREDEIKSLVVDDKWFARIRAALEGEVERVTQRLAGRVRELEERYARPLPELEKEVEALSVKVKGHLERMGVGWG